MKIYTRTGDDGSTGLFGGARVAKDALRVEAYGTVDELNACVGVAIETLTAASGELRSVLLALQSELFDLGAALATAPDRARDRLTARLAPIDGTQVAALEQIIDRYEATLPPLRNFLLPGGCPASAALHHARTVARRAERRIVGLAAREPIDDEILRYSNRLSDLLFVLARAANRLEGVDDVPWTARQAPA